MRPNAPHDILSRLFSKDVAKLTSQKEKIVIGSIFTVAASLYSTFAYALLTMPDNSNSSFDARAQAQSHDTNQDKNNKPNKIELERGNPLHPLAPFDPSLPWSSMDP